MLFFENVCLVGNIINHNNIQFIELAATVQGFCFIQTRLYSKNGTEELFKDRLEESTYYSIDRTQFMCTYGDLFPFLNFLVGDSPNDRRAGTSPGHLSAKQKRLNNYLRVTRNLVFVICINADQLVLSLGLLKPLLSISLVYSRTPCRSMARLCLPDIEHYYRKKYIIQNFQKLCFGLVTNLQTYRLLT